jgi:hypothetical protein
VVFMHNVVAVDRILPDPVAEAEEDLNTFVRMHFRHVLASVLLDGQNRRRAVAREDLVLLEVDMDGVRPISRKVREYPLFRAVLRHGETEVVAVHELTVDRPLPVQAIKLEGANDPRSNVGAGRSVERGVGLPDSRYRP